jgi:cephalosporin hydroxylase
MNDLEYFFKNKRLEIPITKWTQYFDIYDTHFSKFRNKEIVILEIGVWKGGSLLMWEDYFGENAKIYGIDNDANCQNIVEGKNIKIIIGSQSDREFLRELKTQIPKIDILIDDGGHRMEEQIITFEELYDHIKDGGIYLCEDLHTSYNKNYGGGLENPNSFIEYSKKLIDKLNAFSALIPNELPITKFTTHTNSIHYYDSVIVIEKKLRKPPVRIDR